MKFLKLLSMTTFILLNVSHAQFGKYKNKTKYNPSSSDIKAQQNADNSVDIFGRNKNESSPKSITTESNKFVNLNPETAFGPEIITSFDFPNTTLLDLTKHMQKLTGINIIFDKDIKGKVNIMAPSAITVGDAWKAYLTALNMNGLTLVKSGAFYKVVGARDVRSTPTKIYTGDFTPDTENYIMRIIPLKHINGSEISRNFRPFMSRFGRLVEIKQTNTVIVLDTGNNIRRLMRLISFLDVPGHEESLHIIKVEHSSAQEIAKLLDTILKGRVGSSRKSSRASSKNKESNISRITAESRTNSIIAMATDAGAKELETLIRKLDVKVASTGSDRIHVYYLHHSDAEALSKTLSTLVSGSTSKTTTRRTSSRLSSRLQRTEGSQLFTADVKVTADKDNNALVVTASPTDWLTIKNVIGKLDIPRDQVYVEGMIMETQVSDGNQFGISLLGATGSGSLQKYGFTGGSKDLENLLTNQITALGGLFIGGGAGKKYDVDVGGNTVQVQTINGLISAIASDSRTNVLATPQILARDNVEAVFEVGETVPITETTNAANGSSTNAVKQQKVALTLKIKPQINKVTRFIKLKIDQKIDDFSQRSNSAGSGGVATTTRAAVTEAEVRDRDTIAMGGLMRDQEVEKINKVPLLGDIPVLGWLFKRREKGRSKVNLLFFLTPRILSNPQATASHLRETMNRRAAHIKNSLGEEDPFQSTAKGLYHKAKKQADGPLYNPEDAQRYRDTNNSEGIGNLPAAKQDDEIEVPNYKQIAKEAEAKKAGKEIMAKKPAKKEVELKDDELDLVDTELEDLDEELITPGMNDESSSASN